MTRILWLAAAALLAGCRAPGPAILAPVPSLVGTWHVSAVNGRPATGVIEIAPPALHASFGCNSGRGSARVDGLRLVVTLPMAVTERGCVNPDGSPAATMRDEDEGFRVVTRTALATFDGPDRVRLANPAGSIDLTR